MKWARDYDYHGSRTYERNEPEVGHFSLMLHWTANVVREWGRRLTRRTPPPAFTSFEFSVLGGEKGDAMMPTPSHAPAANAPGRPAANVNLRDWRVLP